MEKESKLIFGTVFLFIVITSGISLVPRLCSALLFESMFKGFQVFFVKDIFWFVTVIGIVCFMMFYFAKRRISVKQDFLNDKSIQFSSGILVLIDGVISLSSSVPIRIMSIHSARTVMKQADNIASSFILENLISNIIPIFILVVQIGLGIIMITKSKKLGT